MRNLAPPLKNKIRLFSSDNKLLRLFVKSYVLILGILTYFVLTMRFGPYGGHQVFYRCAQTQANHFGNILRSFLSLSLKDLFSDYTIYLDEYQNPRLSEVVTKQYSDDSLGTYGDFDYTKGGPTLDQQIRGLIIPKVQDCLNDFGKANKRICEIGTANGDVLASLQKSFSSSNFSFIGLDFFVTNARLKYPTNVEWVAGYALDTIPQVKPDLIFASSTFMLMTPSELENYTAVLKENGCLDIIISDPFWGPNFDHNSKRKVSYHLEQACWVHNYSAYLNAAGYEQVALEIFPYKHPISPRPDVRQLIGHWRL